MDRVTIEFGAWRASYTPGRWLVLSGPTTAVILQPAPAEASAFVGEVWDSIVSSASIGQVAERLAGFGLDAMPTLAVFFWDDAQLHALLRGDIQVEDARTSRLLADGEGVKTWREVTLDAPVVRVVLDAVPPDRLLQLPLVVGAVSASTLVLDASGQLSRYPAQAGSVAAAPLAQPSLVDAQPVFAASAPDQPEPAAWTPAAAEPDEDQAPSGGLSWTRGAQVVTGAAAAAEAGLAGASQAAGAVMPAAAAPATPPIAEPPLLAGAPGAVGQFAPGAPSAAGATTAESASSGWQQAPPEFEPASSGFESASPGFPQSPSGFEEALPGPELSPPGFEAAPAEPEWMASGRPASDAIPFAERATQLLPSVGFEPDGPGSASPGFTKPTEEPSLNGADWAGSPDRPNAFMFEPTKVLDNQPPESTFPPEAPPEPEPVAVGGDHVLATFCASGHPNQPGAASCRVCGQILDARAVQLIPTPVLARLVVSSGEVIALSRPVLLGRAPVPPADDVNVILVRLSSPQHDISRTHCLISPRDWSVEVTDMGSTNGTVIINPGQSPVRLVPYEPFIADLGAVVDVGDGQFVRIDPA